MAKKKKTKGLKVAVTIPFKQKRIALTSLEAMDSIFHLEHVAASFQSVCSQE